MPRSERVGLFIKRVVFGWLIVPAFRKQEMGKKNSQTFLLQVKDYSVATGYGGGTLPAALPWQWQILLQDNRKRERETRGSEIKMHHSNK